MSLPEWPVRPGHPQEGQRSHAVDEHHQGDKDDSFHQVSDHRILPSALRLTRRLDVHHRQKARGRIQQIAVLEGRSMHDHEKGHQHDHHEARIPRRWRAQVIPGRKWHTGLARLDRGPPHARRHGRLRFAGWLCNAHRAPRAKPRHLSRPLHKIRRNGW